MRAFVSLELPAEIKTEIENIQQQLKRAGVQARWVRPELSHLTLAFLGSITPDKVEPISEILDKVAAQIKPVNLQLSKIGCFPSPAKARVIFVGLAGELGKLKALAIKIRKQLKKEKIYFDKKPFVSHITLGRVKKQQNLTQQIEKTKIKSVKTIRSEKPGKVKFVAGEVSLTKSTLTESGPIYTKLKCVSLE